MDGKDIRLKQLFRKSRRTFILPVDHGVTIGPVQGLNDMPALLRQVGRKVDGIVVHKGMVKQIAKCIDSKYCSIIVHLSASTALAADPGRKEIVTSVEHALKLGATAVSLHVNLGSATEADMLKDMGITAELCDSWGIPLLAMMYVRDGTKESEFDPAKIKHAARVAQELGADIVKVNYSGSSESFAEVVKSVSIPVVIAGGPKMSSDDELLSMVEDAVRAGAGGVALGRNLFQHAQPGIIAERIRKLLDF